MSVLARDDIVTLKYIYAYETQEKEAFKKRDEGKLKVPPLFLRD